MSREPVFHHTPQTDAIIRAAYDATTPIIDIARTLNTTRNTIIGRAKRLGLCRSWNTVIGQLRFYGDSSRVAQRSERIRQTRFAKVNTAHKLKTEA